jgi:hypothetical protein
VRWRGLPGGPGGPALAARCSGFLLPDAVACAPPVAVAATSAWASDTEHCLKSMRPPRGTMGYATGLLE